MSLHNAVLWVALLVIGLAWGSTQLFSKLIVNGGHHPVGISFTGTVLGLLLLVAFLAARGQRLPLSRRHLIFYAICGLTGTALPHILGFTAMQELPIGVMSIVIALVPIMTYLGALLLRMERVSSLRMLGLLCGTASVMMLVLPEASLPRADQAIWIILPVLMSLCLHHREYLYRHVAASRYRPDADDVRVVPSSAYLADPSSAFVR